MTWLIGWLLLMVGAAAGFSFGIRIGKESEGTKQYDAGYRQGLRDQANSARLREQVAKLAEVTSPTSDIDDRGQRVPR